MPWRGHQRSHRADQPLLGLRPGFSDRNPQAHGPTRAPSRSRRHERRVSGSKRLPLLIPDTGPGSVVYLESSENPITIGGNTPMGSPERPAIVVVDTLNSGHAIDWRGTSQFYGVVIVVGDAMLRGTHDIRGCVLSAGAVENKGGPGVRYNGDCVPPVERAAHPQRGSRAKHLGRVHGARIAS